MLGERVAKLFTAGGLGARRVLPFIGTVTGFELGDSDDARNDGILLYTIVWDGDSISRFEELPASYLVRHTDAKRTRGHCVDVSAEVWG